MAFLALLQCVLLFVFSRLQFNIDAAGPGWFLFPLVRLIFAYAREGGIFLTVGFYLVFAFAMVLDRSWAWAVGLVAACLNLLGIIPSVLTGTVPVRIMVVGAFPLALLVYLSFPTRDS